MERPTPEGLFEDTKPGSHPNTADAPAEAPSAALLAGSRAVSLRTQEGGQFVNINYDGWAVFGGQSATKYVLVQYGNESYIVVADGRWKGYYLSYNRNSYVGAYKDWNRASYFSIDPVDCSPYPGLYPYNIFVCCNGVKDAIDRLVTVVGY
jgi:hypothetical protein